MSTLDTIFAQSSKIGKAGVAVFRISGPSALNIIISLITTQKRGGSGEVSFKITPRRMHYGKIYDPWSGNLIDDAMFAYFKAPHSFTGEDVVEIYTHGSIAITKMLYELLAKFKNTRIAKAGEFTRRAFVNAKIDLTTAEGIRDLIIAETAMQHKQSVLQASGFLKEFYTQLRNNIIKGVAFLEAQIDFSDQEIEDEALSEALEIIQDIKNTIQKLVQNNARGEIIRNGIKLSIIGSPNVGKSSLLNFVSKREVAIVSDIEGTTRDVLENNIDIGGYAFIVQDTAGIRSNSYDLIENEGIKRAITAAQNADIKIIMLDALQMHIPNELKGLINQNNSIIVINKIDKLKGVDLSITNNELLRAIGIVDNINNNEQDAIQNLPHIVAISIKELRGLDELTNLITKIADNIAAGVDNEIVENIANIDHTSADVNHNIPIITSARQCNNLVAALEYISKCDPTIDIVLAIENLRSCATELEEITGSIDNEAILGEIFSSFCIGK